MARKSFPIRFEPETIARLEKLAAAHQVSKTSIVEDGLNLKMDMLEGYLAMDKGPPKKTKATGLTLKPGGVNYVEGFHDVDVVVGRLMDRRPIGWDADGTPIYRGAK